MATGSDLELQKLREQLRQAEERAGQAEARPGQAEARARDEQANRLRAERRVEEERIRNENTTFRDFLKLCHSALDSDSGRQNPHYQRLYHESERQKMPYFSAPMG